MIAIKLADRLLLKILIARCTALRRKHRDGMPGSLLAAQIRQLTSLSFVKSCATWLLLFLVIEKDKKVIDRTQLAKGIQRLKRPPKFSHHRGRTWDQCDVILLDGTRIKGTMDTTWGTHFYFLYPDETSHYVNRETGERVSWCRGSIDDYRNCDSYGYICVFDMRERTKA